MALEANITPHSSTLNIINQSVGWIAQWVECRAKKPGAVLTRIGFSMHQGIFLLESTFSAVSLLVFVQPCL